MTDQTESASEYAELLADLDFYDEDNWRNVMRQYPGAQDAIRKAAAAIRALGTIRQVMPTPLRHRIDALEFTAIGRPGAAAPVTASLDVLVTLAQTISDRQTLCFDYSPRDGADDGEDHHSGEGPSGDARRRGSEKGDPRSCGHGLFLLLARAASCSAISSRRIFTSRRNTVRGRGRSMAKRRVPRSAS